jgi:hypothetical protein
MKKISLLFLCALLFGCTTISRVSPRLNLGMTKAEVLKKCGPPRQAGAMKDNDLQIIETFKYTELPFFHSASTEPITTYVYFLEGNVVYYGPSPRLPKELISEHKKQDRRNQNSPTLTAPARVNR